MTATRCGTAAVPRGARTERGLTLIELLVSVAIFGLLIVPLAATVVLALRSTAETQERFTGSRAAQTAAAYFANDVQSAATVTLTDAAPCGGSSNAPAAVSLRWSDDLDGANVVSYTVQTAGAERRLVRVACVAGNGAVKTVVAHGLDAAPPAVSCLPSCVDARSVSLRAATTDGHSFELRGTRRSR